MCGIAGWVDWDTDLTAKKPILEAMRETLAPRGPDASGMWVSPHAAFVHRRLVVIDPTGGSQPMIRRRGDQRNGPKYILIYNGELYNTAELRADLAALGYSFEGHSDTEVLLLSFIEWGPACLERLNGIFAFAVWNQAEQSLFLARDRLGVKPLFFSHSGSRFIFGSELKALLANPAVPAEIDAEGLAEIFALGPSRTPGHGVFRGIAELKPGWCLEFDRRGRRERPYWSLVSRPHSDSLPDTCLRVRELLADTVERQLVSDVPICTLLSGGLDSSALTAFAAAAYRRDNLGPVHTWSVDYLDNDRHFRSSDYQPNSDAPWTSRVSEYLQSVHHPVVIDTPALMQALVPAMRARDLPGMADIDASLLLFCSEIKKAATVAISGECADEVFGGYPWFYRDDALNAGTFPWSIRLAERLRLLSPDLIRLMRPEEYVADRYRQALNEVPRLAGEDGLNDRMREMFYLNLTRWMPTLLDRKDRMSMAVGLEVRVPFCDHRLVEYVWNVPWEIKYREGREKGLLRQALTGVLPEDVLWRRKSPYPKTHHPAYLEATSSLMLGILADSDSPLVPLINTEAVRELATGAKERAERGLSQPYFGQLMGDAQWLAHLAQIDTWMREYGVSVVG